MIENMRSKLGSHNSHASYGDGFTAGSTVDPVFAEFKDMANIKSNIIAGTNKCSVTSLKKTTFVGI